MLQKILIKCQLENDQKANYQWGSLFHGLLMESLSAEIVDQFHVSQLRPFSQYVLPDAENRLSWHIGLWNNEFADSIVKAVMPMTEIYLKQKELKLKVVEANKYSLSKQEYFSGFFTAPAPCRRYEIRFLTPCTHKQDGRYALFPSPELIIQSIFMRYNTFIQDYSLDDAVAMEHLIQNTRIVNYSLSSAVYYLENARIAGYLGRITLSIKGPEQLARLAGAVLTFAEYSGIGIKTALGMGGVSIRQIHKG
jgi:CRISPR-associated endoribonuclease Cas6